ncbi:MAG: hypothetical protein ACXW5U_11475 [Thermoanaerobaculia bacterium]
MLTPDEAERRRSLHYAGVLEDIDRQLDPQGKGIEEAKRRFQSEWENIGEGWAWAATNFRTNDDAAQLCDRYGIAGARMMARASPPDLSIRWAATALRSARRLGLSPARECAHLVNLARAYSMVGDSTQAARTLVEAESVAGRVSGENVLQARVRVARVENLIDRKDWDLAVGFARHAMTFVTGHSDGRVQYDVFWQLAEAYRGAGELDEAVHYHQTAAVWALHIGDRALEAMAAAGMGVALVQRGATWRGRFLLRRGAKFAARSQDLHANAFCDCARMIADAVRGKGERASARLRDLIDIARRTGYWRVANHAMGVVLQLQGAPEDGLEMLVARDTVDFARQAGDRRAEAHKVAQMADYFFGRGDVASRSMYKLARRLAHELHDADLVARVTVNLLTVHAKTGDHDEVIELAEDEMPNLVVTCSRRYELEARETLAAAYEAVGRRSDAKREYEKALAAAEARGDEEARKRIAAAVAMGRGSV